MEQTSHSIVTYNSQQDNGCDLNKLNIKEQSVLRVREDKTAIILRGGATAGKSTSSELTISLNKLVNTGSGGSQSYQR